MTANLVLGTDQKDCGCIERRELVQPNSMMRGSVETTITVSQCSMHRHKKQSYAERPL